MAELANNSIINGRVYWGKNPSLPKSLDLIRIQKNSYQQFLDEGIKELLVEISPISDFTGKKADLHLSSVCKKAFPSTLHCGLK